MAMRIVRTIGKCIVSRMPNGNYDVAGYSPTSNRVIHRQSSDPAKAEALFYATFQLQLERALIERKLEDELLK